MKTDLKEFTKDINQFVYEFQNAVRKYSGEIDLLKNKNIEHTKGEKKEIEERKKAAEETIKNLQKKQIEYEKIFTRSRRLPACVLSDRSKLGSVLA